MKFRRRLYDPVWKNATRFSHLPIFPSLLRICMILSILQALPRCGNIKRAATSIEVANTLVRIRGRRVYQLFVKFHIIEISSLIQLHFNCDILLYTTYRDGVLTCAHCSYPNKLALYSTFTLKPRLDQMSSLTFRYGNFSIDFRYRRDVFYARCEPNEEILPN